MSESPGNESVSLKKLLVVDPAHEGDRGIAAEIFRLVDDSKLIYTIEKQILASAKDRYYCAVLVLTRHVNMTALLIQKLCALSKALRSIAIIDNSKQGTDRVAPFSIRVPFMIFILSPSIHNASVI